MFANNDNPRLTDEKLEELIKLGEKATPAPWAYDSYGVLEKGCKCGSCTETVGWELEYKAPLFCPEEVDPDLKDLPDLLKFEDADFIIEARKYWLPLLQEVQQLRKDITSLVSARREAGHG